MKVACRVDASELIGTGHMHRCLALGDALRTLGAELHMISARGPADMAGVVEARGFSLLQIDAGDGNWEADARATAGLLAARGFDWLVVDHYALGRPWEQALRPHVGKLLAIDDLGRAHDCDVLLDQNYVVDASGRYEGRLPVNCEVLLGPEFALLGAEVAEHARRNSDSVRRALIYFGGSDPGNLTGLAVEALSVQGLRDIELDIVLGRNSRHREAVEALAMSRGHARVHGFQRSLAPLLAAADLAVGAGGVTALERLALGLPSLVVAIADNQNAGCQALAASGLVDHLGPMDFVTREMISERAMGLRSDARRLGSMSSGGMSLVDGRGAARVARRMAA